MLYTAIVNIIILEQTGEAELNILHLTRMGLLCFSSMTLPIVHIAMEHSAIDSYTDDFFINCFS